MQTPCNRFLILTTFSAVPFLLNAQSGMPSICGVLLQNNKIATGERHRGLYEISTINDNEHTLLIEGVSAQFGGVRSSNFYYTPRLDSETSVYLDVYDLTDNEFVKSLSLDNLEFIAPAGYAVDPSTELIFAISYDSEGKGMQLTSYDFNPTLPVARKIAAIPGHWVACAIDSDGNMYGIRLEDGHDAVLYAINKATGDLREIGSTGVNPYYASGAIIDPACNRMYWVVNPADGSGALYEVDLSTGSTTEIYQFADNDEIAGLYIAESSEGVEIPTLGACTELQANFTAPSTTGTISWHMPDTTEYIDTDTDAYSLSATILIDGSEFSTLDGLDFGQEVETTISVETPGFHIITVYAHWGEIIGAKQSATAYVGEDKPQPADVSLQFVDNEMQLNWTPVNHTIHGEEIDSSSVTYRVTRNDGEVLADGLTESGFSETITHPEKFATYRYVVYALCGTTISDPAESEPITIGYISSTFAFDYNNKENLDGWNIFDANQDGITWSLHGDKMRIMYNMDKPMDDWLISPPIRIKENQTYSIRFNTHAYDPVFPEKLEVLLCDSDQPENIGSSITLMPSTEISASSDNPLLFEAELKPEATGIYHVCFHGVSDSNRYFLYLDNFTVEDKNKHTGLEQINGSKSDCQIIASNRNIIIMNPGGAQISISSAEGITIYTDKGVEHSIVEVDPGMYIINVGNTSKKIIIL